MKFTKQKVEAILQRHESLLDMARNFIDDNAPGHQRTGAIRFLYGNRIEEYVNASCRCHPEFEWVDRGSVEEFIKWIEKKNT